MKPFHTHYASLLRRRIKSVPLTFVEEKLLRRKLLKEKSANKTIAFTKAK